MEAFPRTPEFVGKVTDLLAIDGNRLAERIGGHLSEVEHGCQQDLRAAQTVAALYVDPAGVYSEAENVELWDEARDARLYVGPHRVVAHPPCARWCALAPLVQAIHGYRIGDDGGTFACALDAVREFGGILEHPAYSYAWLAFGLPRPMRGRWTAELFQPGWVTEVSQSAYGHPTRKRTWLYYVGGDPPMLDWSEPPVTQTVSDFGPGSSRRRGDEWVPGVQYAEASRTPIAFRDVLLDAARRG